jgi:hypothetical protein
MKDPNKKQCFQILCYDEEEKRALLPLFYLFYKEVNALKVKSRRKDSFKHNSAFLSVGYCRKPIGKLYSDKRYEKEKATVSSTM